jgi:competence protein ComEC
VPAQRCQAGQAWAWDGVLFEVLHPQGSSSGASPRPNTLSCVLRVQGATGSALLTGDIESAQEAELVRQLGPALASDVLLVPHHGSRTSSTPGFIEAVAPRWAVVQAAYRSRYGHPAPDVLARYAASGVTVVRSDACGAFLWAPGTAGECVRLTRARYWHHPHRQVLPPARPP